MKRYNITYTGWINFFFWFFPNQSLKKVVELGEDQGGGIRNFKSDRYEGFAKKVNSTLMFLIRYSLMSLMLILLFPKLYVTDITFWASMIISLTISGILILQIFYREKTTFLYLCGGWAIIFLLFSLYYVFHPVYGSLLMFMLSTFRSSFFFYLIFVTIYDYQNIKTKKFFVIPEQRIVFYV